MPQSLYVSLLIFCASFARGCYLDSEKWARCSSFEELAGDGPQNWRSVYLSGNTKQEHVTIPAGAFGNLTDVHNILISRMLKDIDPGTFKDIKKLDWLKMGDNTLHKLRGEFETSYLRGQVCGNVDKHLHVHCYEHIYVTAKSRYPSHFVSNYEKKSKKSANPTIPRQNNSKSRIQGPW